MAHSCGCGWPHTHTNLITINAHTCYHPPFTLTLILHRHCHRHEHDLLTFFIPRLLTGIHLLFSQMTLDFLSFLIFLEIGTSPRLHPLTSILILTILPLLPLCFSRSSRLSTRGCDEEKIGRVYMCVTVCLRSCHFIRIVLYSPENDSTLEPSP